MKVTLTNEQLQSGRWDGMRQTLTVSLTTAQFHKLCAQLSNDTCVDKGPDIPRSNNFSKDLAQGILIQHQLDEVLKSSHEVKFERMGRETRNHAAEYQCRGKASGYKTTTADCWSIGFGGHRFITVPTRWMAALADGVYDRCPGRRKEGGDDKESFFVTVPFEWIIGVRPPLWVKNLEVELGLEGA